MTNKEAESRIKKAVEACTPDVLDRVISQCTDKKGELITMTKKNNNNFVRKFAAVAAALIVLVGAGVFGYNYRTASNAVASIVSIDVNPGIEMTLNKNAKVLEAKALNADAEKVLEGLELKGTQANTATSAIIGSLLKNGYIDELANSILISVEDNDDARGEKLQNELTAQVTATLEESAASAAILAQHTDGKDKNAAEEYGISSGKAALVEKIIDANPTYNKEELAKLSVNELNLIISNPKNEVKEVATSGQASDKQYIGADKAKAAALNHVSLKEADIFDVEIDFDYEFGKMIYEVSFDTKNREYEIHVDALTGKIVTAHSEYDRNNPEATTAAPANESKDIGKDKAKEIALNKAGVKEANVTGLRVTSDYDDGRLEYNVEFVHEKKKYEYEINAANGSITDYDIDYHSALDEIEDKYDDKYDDDDDDYVPPAAVPDDNGVNVGKKLTAEVAKQFALKKAGVKESDVKKLRVEKDYDDGRTEYSVEFTYNGNEYEYEINGDTGTIIDFDVEKAERFD
ncbi:MAG: PepSY domain-containing protein [Clostridia bacterium]|nr:PepSY domain-containing protein [Clostridia bacterium]